MDPHICTCLLIYLFIYITYTEIDDAGTSYERNS
jgi:hypothetical protein